MSERITMLDRQKLHGEIARYAQKRRPVYANINKTAEEVWKWLVTHERELKQRAGEKQLAWHEPLGGTYSFCNGAKSYQVIGIDGSQVYPSRHEGSGCFLINIGYFDCIYAIESRVQRASDPRLYDDHLSVYELSNDLVDLRRTELELIAGLERAQAAQEKVLVFFDGSLIFWHLEHKDARTREHFLERYLELLLHYEVRQVPIIAYISSPNAKDLVNLTKETLTREGENTYSENAPTIAKELFSYIYDRYLMPLNQLERSAIFEPRSRLVERYPGKTRPLFFYMNAGSEMARIEFPCWLYQETSLFEWCLGVIKDQCVKGGGYPVALAEAHEAAVIKQADKQLFYQMMNRLESGRGGVWSRKHVKKRLVGV